LQLQEMMRFFKTHEQPTDFAFAKVANAPRAGRSAAPAARAPDPVDEFDNAQFVKF